MKRTFSIAAESFDVALLKATVHAREFLSESQVAYQATLTLNSVVKIVKENPRNEDPAIFHFDVEHTS